MNWLKQVWTYLRKLPIAAWIKPLWKQALKDLLQKEGDQCQVLLRSAVAAEGPGAIERVIDGWLGAVKRGLERLPLPGWAKEWAIDFLGRHGSELKAKLIAVAERGPDAIDVAFDAAQAVLISRVDAL